MNIMLRYFVLLLVICLCIQIYAKTSRDLEEKIKGLDAQTKRRVLALHAAGVPHHEIAKKISYLTGKDARQAEKLVEGIKKEDKINRSSFDDKNSKYAKKNAKNSARNIPKRK
jgi:hypothetical protein